MIDQNSVLILSGSLFCIGLIGILGQPRVVKTVISLEIMIFAGILNFCYFAGADKVNLGHIAAVAIAILSGLTLAIIFAVLVMQFRQNDSLDILREATK